MTESGDEVAVSSSDTPVSCEDEIITPEDEDSESEVAHSSSDTEVSCDEVVISSDNDEETVKAASDVSFPETAVSDDDEEISCDDSEESVVTNSDDDAAVASSDTVASCDDVPCEDDTTVGTASEFEMEVYVSGRLDCHLNSESVEVISCEEDAMTSDEETTLVSPSDPVISPDEEDIPGDEFDGTASDDKGAAVTVSAGRHVQYPRLAVVFGDNVAVVDISDSSYVLRSEDVTESLSLQKLSWEADGPSKDDADTWAVSVNESVTGRAEVEESSSVSDSLDGLGHVTSVDED